MLRSTLRPLSTSDSRQVRGAMRGWLGLLALLPATFVLALQGCAQQQEQPEAQTLAFALPGVVTRVIDGDTIDVNLASGPIRVRFHAIDTPERGQPGGAAATEALEALVAGKQVALEPFEQDSYDRLVARVYADGYDVNGTLVQLGHAWVFRQYMTRDDAAYCTLEHEARRQKRGLWALPPEQRIAPWEWRKRESRSTFTDYSRETAENCIATIGALASAEAPAKAVIEPKVAGEPFTCATKMYCREMVSCEEARFYLAKCGLTRLDGDGDGIPCDTLCR